MLGLQGQLTRRQRLTISKCPPMRLAKRLPALLVEASRVAQTVAHGIHGRRRAGPGETFWQFRHYREQRRRAAIDWRRSACSDHLFIREKRMGSGAHAPALARPVAVDGVPLASLHRHQARPRADPGLRHRRTADRRRRARRPAWRRRALGRTQDRAQDRAGHRPQQAGADAISRACRRARRSRASRNASCSATSSIRPTNWRRLEHIAAQGVRGHLIQILDPGGGDAAL